MDATGSGHRALLPFLNRTAAPALSAENSTFSFEFLCQYRMCNLGALPRFFQPFLTDKHERLTHKKRGKNKEDWMLSTSPSQANTHTHTHTVTPCTLRCSNADFLRKCFFFFSLLRCHGFRRAKTVIDPSHLNTAFFSCSSSFPFFPPSSYSCTQLPWQDKLHLMPVTAAAAVGPWTLCHAARLSLPMMREVRFSPLPQEQN